MFHYYMVHARFVTVTFDGEAQTLERNSSCNFQCPRCHFSAKGRRTTISHVKRCGVGDWDTDADDMYSSLSELSDSDESHVEAENSENEVDIRSASRGAVFLDTPLSLETDVDCPVTSGSSVPSRRVSHSSDHPMDVDDDDPFAGSLSPRTLSSASTTSTTPNEGRVPRRFLQGRRVDSLETSSSSVPASDERRKFLELQWSTQDLPPLPPTEPTLRSATPPITVIRGYEDDPVLLARAENRSVEELTTMILPSEDCVWDDDLIQNGLVVNMKHKFVSCTTCLQCIPPRKLHAHLRAHHMSPRPTLAEELISKYGLHHNAPPKPTTVVPAIFGVRIEARKLFCVGCLSGYDNQKSLKQHFVSCKKPHERKSFEACAQVFQFKGGKSGSSYFPVLVPSASDLPAPHDLARCDSTLHALLKAKPPDDFSDQPVTAPDNKDALRLFLRRQSWVAHVEGLTPLFISSMLCCPFDLPSGHMRSACEAYVLSLQDRLEQLPESVRFAVTDWQRCVVFRFDAGDRVLSRSQRRRAQ